MSVVQADFDRLAALDSEGWTQNNHYHNFLLRHVRNGCQNALEIGCGTGAFARRLVERAQHVVALDLSPEMIRVARSRSAECPNIEFHVADAMSWVFPAAHFDCIATIATLHHLPLRGMILKLKPALKPGGVLIVLDLFEPERNLFTAAGLLDTFLNIVAMGVSVSLRLIHNGRLKPPREVRAAWAAHEQHDSYPTMSDVRKLCTDILPGAKVRKHLMWRYSTIWQKLDTGVPQPRPAGAHVVCERANNVNESGRRRRGLDERSYCESPEA
jgi:ubiquinone/menaquinone biosynthesis C-methylase UbiE